MDTLASLRVLNTSSHLSGAYCARLLRDGGAHVIRILDAPGADGADPAGPLDAYLFGGIDGVSAAPADLYDAADVLICDSLGGPGRPELVVVSITAFGTRGPDSARPSTALTRQAYAGVMDQHGIAEREPLAIGGRIDEWVAGSYAAVAALAALRARDRTGLGEVIDVAVAECLFASMTALMSVWDDLGGDSPPGPTRSIPLPGIERAADGWLGFTTTNKEMFDRFLDMIERPDLAAHPDLASPFGRSRHRGVVQPAIDAWVGERSVAANFEAARTRRIPVSPVNSPGDVLRSDHATLRRIHQRDTAGHLHVRSPFVVDGSVPDLQLGRQGQSWRDRPPVTPAGTDQDLPLSGVRVVDLTTWWAGSAATALLGALGAEVVKVESIQHPDGARARPTKPHGTPHRWEWSWVYAAANHSKLGITLDLSSAEGLDIAWRILRNADLVLENFAPGVVERWGITWAELHEVNPRASLVRMPAFGSWGPWRDTRGFDPTISQACGLAWINGYADGPPMVPRSICDPLSGVHAAIAALLALGDADRTGSGHLVESAMFDVMAVTTAEATLSGATPTRSGNRSPSAAPQGAYRCAGEDEWVAISITDDAAWKALCAVAPWPEATADVSADERMARHDQLDSLISSWTADQDADVVAERLRSAGVPAEQVRTSSAAARSAQFRFRGFLETIDHPVIGLHTLPGLPFRFESRQEGWIRRSAPCLGEHNATVLGSCASQTVADLERLAALGVIGTVPVPTGAS